MAVQPRLPWKRFWASRDAHFHVDSGAFLSDPDAPYSRLLDDAVQTLTEIRDLRCLILLGEPGIGKSDAVVSAQTTIAASVANEDRALLVDLRQFGSEDRLYERLTGSSEIAAWRSGKGVLELFLDGFDECLLRVDTLALLLPEAIRELPIDRLRLRVVCRTGSWPTSLEGTLAGLFGAGSVGVYELLPLRRRDVEMAAAAAGADVAAFLEDVLKRDVVALAARPLTLRMLLGLFVRDGHLPTSREEAYLKGCRVLVAENADSRFSARTAGVLDADARLSIAASIAAAMLFSAREAVSVQSENENPSDEVLLLHELRGEFEARGANRDMALREVLGSGLFSSRGPDLFGWAHHSYAEFLAAHCLRVARVDHQQVRTLITGAADPEMRVVPQLTGTAAWCATMIPGLLDDLVKRDPATLLRGDLALAPGSVRAALVEELLLAVREGRVVGSEWSMSDHLYKLRHSELAAQIRPALQENADPSVSALALRIAEECGVSEVQLELLDLAHNAKAPVDLRASAVRALGRIGDAPTRSRLSPLISTAVNEDPDDQLRGSVLQVLWPQDLSADTAFETILPPRNPDLFGQYKHFLRTEFVRALREEDLALALDWTLTRPTGSSTLRDVDDQIVLRCLANDSGEISAGRLAEVLLARLKRDHEVVHHSQVGSLRRVLRQNRSRRLAVSAAVVARASERTSLWRLVRDTELLERSDLAWVLEQLSAADSGSVACTNLILLTRVLCDERDCDAIDLLLSKCSEDAILGERLRETAVAIDLDSELARGSRAALAQERQWELELESQRTNRKTPTSDELADDIERCLTRCESGESEAFWRLAYSLRRDDKGHLYNELSPRLFETPGWNASSIPIRSRIVDAASKYVVAAKQAGIDWIAARTLHRPSFAVLDALHLIAHERYELVAELPESVWREWASVIVAHPGHDMRDDEVARMLMRKAYEAAPGECVTSLVALIEQEVSQHNQVFCLERVLHVWDARLSSCVLERAKAQVGRPTAILSLLGPAMEHGDEEATEWCRSRVVMGDQDIESWVVFAALLVRWGGRADWDSAWELAKGMEERGTAFLKVLSALGANELLARMPETSLGDLYVVAASWSVGQDLWRGPTAADAGVVRMREAAINALKVRGTFTAVAELERLAASDSRPEQFKYLIAEARSTARAQSWLPVPPAQLFRLLRANGSRLVRSGSELRRVLIESIQRLGQKLHDETPAVVDLWNQLPGGTAWRPKDEQSLSDYIARHLRSDLGDRGVVVNREVEVRRGVGGSRGQRSDLHVSATTSGGTAGEDALVKVIVEVKGCWNADVEEAMKTQLYDRYLRENSCTDGIYLVGKFSSDHWDATDPRTGPSRRWSFEELRRLLELQARKLPRENGVIDAYTLDCALR